MGGRLNTGDGFRVGTLAIHGDAMDHVFAEGLIDGNPIHVVRWNDPAGVRPVRCTTRAAAEAARSVAARTGFVHTTPGAVATTKFEDRDGTPAGTEVSFGQAVRVFIEDTTDFDGIWTRCVLTHGSEMPAHGVLFQRASMGMTATDLHDPEVCYIR